MLELSSHHAKRIVIKSQGLQKAKVFGRGDRALLNCIRQLGYVQIDTISVINRAHHHTFWARIPSYREGQLDSLQKNREILEYWSHAASYLPMEDYRYCLPYMKAIASGQKHWRERDKKTMRLVLDQIRSGGAAMARDFESPKNSNPGLWGGVKPAKIALEQLFIEGELVISHRDRFQKVFDLPERILPDDLDTSMPTKEEFCRYLIDRAIRSQGFVSEAEIGYLRKGIKSDLVKQIQQMLADQEIIQVGVKGSPIVYYSRTPIIEQGMSTRVAKKVHLLSPFDNLVIQRKRIAQLFDFDYQIECYVPSSKRKHGYFCLPILYGVELVGRLDPKADRKNETLIIRNLVIEKNIGDQDVFVEELAKKINHFATFNRCEQTVIERCNDKKLGDRLTRLVP